jgi:SAM-dependent methyltransferase
MEDAAGHWESVFETKATDEVSWFQAVPAVSLRLLERWASPAGSVIDVGAGASTLVDSLLDAGWTDVTILDVSETALTRVRNRLGRRAEAVTFVTADIRSWHPNRTYDAWHDRAVFHFLVEPTDRDHYVATATQAVASGGVLVLATFAADGPTECSGLPTSRYDPDELVRAFGSAFALEHAEREEHATPSGSIQPFSWVVLRRLLA